MDVATEQGSQDLDTVWSQDVREDGTARLGRVGNEREMAVKDHRPDSFLRCPKCLGLLLLNRPSPCSSAGDEAKPSSRRDSSRRQWLGVSCLWSVHISHRSISRAPSVRNDAERGAVDDG